MSGPSEAAKQPVGTNEEAAATRIRSEATEGVWGILPPMDKPGRCLPAGPSEASASLGTQKDGLCRPFVVPAGLEPATR